MIMMGRRFEVVRARSNSIVHLELVVYRAHDRSDELLPTRQESRPATGWQLWRAVARQGTFSQLTRPRRR